MDAARVSEIDVLEWIGNLTSQTVETRNAAKAHLREAGTDALPWLAYAYNGNSGRNAEIEEVVRAIVSKSGIPHKGGRAIRKILGQ